jgi:hypothetical protein
MMGTSETPRSLGAEQIMSQCHFDSASVKFGIIVEEIVFIEFLRISEEF